MLTVASYWATIDGRLRKGDTVHVRLADGRTGDLDRAATWAITSGFDVVVILDHGGGVVTADGRTVEYLDATMPPVLR